METLKDQLRKLRVKLIAEITDIVRSAPDKMIRFRITHDSCDTDDADQYPDETVLLDLNVGESDADGCYPTVVHARIDLGDEVIVCCENSYDDPEYKLADLSADDLSALHEGLLELTGNVN